MKLQPSHLRSQQFLFGHSTNYFGVIANRANEPANAWRRNERAVIGRRSIRASQIELAGTLSKSIYSTR